MTAGGQLSTQVGQYQKLEPSGDAETRTEAASTQQSSGLASSPTGVQQNLPKELACVVAAWPTLPEHIKAAIKTLVGTVANSK